MKEDQHVAAFAMYELASMLVKLPAVSICSFFSKDNNIVAASNPANKILFSC